MLGGRHSLRTQRRLSGVRSDVGLAARAPQYYGPDQSYGGGPPQFYGVQGGWRPVYPPVLAPFPVRRVGRWRGAALHAL